MSATTNSENLAARFKDCPGAFYMLKGVLCATHVLSREDQLAFEKIFDTMVIARAMDDMNREALAGIRL